jgi:hypothetical protein
MALKEFTPEPVEIIVSGQVRLSVEPPQVNEAPGGLYPLQTKSFEMDEFRIRQGWPVEVPAYDIRCNTLISASGEVIALRDDSTAIETGALIRWIADPDYYDEDALIWRPFQDATGGISTWETSVEYAPVLVNDYEYRVKDERFVQTALNFDSDTRNHMWADFTGSIGGSTGYTVIMVMSPNSAYGNNVAVPYNGLWCPGRATPEGESFAEDIGDSWHSVTMQGGYLYFATESKAPVRMGSITPELNSNAPMFLAMIFGYPTVTIYVGSGPEDIRISSTPTGLGMAHLDDGVVLGRSTGDVLHTADMALFDLSIYANQLTPVEVQNEFALLSRCYGGAE